jgi:pyruvate kinase
MIDNPFPTRAEVSDIYNSVMQHSDAVMLSGETAAGKYPIKSVQVMSATIGEAEKNMNANHRDFSSE